MPHFRLPAFPEVCVMIAVLSGCDDRGAAPPATAKATVTATGTAPAAQSAVIVTIEDQSVHATLHATDADGDPLTFSIADAPNHVVVTLDAASGAFDLQPLTNYFGADSFEYSVSDGHGNTAQARVDVTVQPLPDPPVIDTSATTAVIAAGRDAQLQFAIADPDGDPVTLSVSQTGGTEPLSNLQATDQEVRFHAPDVSAATDVELVLEATDSTGLSTRARHVVTLSPVSATGKLFTVLGTPNSDGLHWVITGDGFTADQQQDLLRASLAMARSLTDAPELARHSGVLNVHVLAAVSRDSGVATFGASRAPRTAFDATLGCTDVERVACVNWDKVYTALLAEHTPFDEIAVVLNTTLYVGNTSGSGLIVSRNSYAPAITLHEMGHVIAGLGDEYVDKNVVDAFLPQLPRRTISECDDGDRSRADSLEALVHRSRAYSGRPWRVRCGPVRRRVLRCERLLPPEAGQQHEDARRADRRSECRGVAASALPRGPADSRRLPRAANRAGSRGH